MYNETYHKLEGENKDYVLKDLTADQKVIASKQIDEANAAGLRKFRVTLVAPDSDGKGGVWFDIENGIVMGSSNEAK